MMTTRAEAVRLAGGWAATGNARDLDRIPARYAGCPRRSRAKPKSRPTEPLKAR